MNIWAWVREVRERLEQGDPSEQRLAELIRELPSAGADEAHERVDAMVPEAIALARDLGEPWVELFIRHWSLQSRVLQRRQAGDELRDAVALLDFASGPRTRECPQSVCAVQDLAVCYAIRDGAGYVAERLAVARETLARIDPTWACFDCISAEYFSALMDDRRPAEALAFIEAQLAKEAEHGEFEPGFNMISNHARALAELGRGEQGLALLDGIRNVGRYGRSRQMTHRQNRVAILLSLERVDEALALHPPLAAVRDSPGHFRDWVDNHAALVERGRIPNTATVGRELLEVQRRLERNDARWDTATTALTGAGLAIARGAREVARLLLADFDRVSPTLRRPELLAGRRRELGEALAALPLRPLNAAPEHEDDDCELLLDHLVIDREQQPDDPELVLELATNLRMVGRADRARALLEREAGASERARFELARALLAEHDHAALDELLADRFAAGERERERSGLHLQLGWVLGESLRERGELDRAIALDQALLDDEPEAIPIRLRLAASARERGDWALALAALDVAAAALEPGPESANVDWDRITAATVLGRWATVRAAAARLGFELPGTGDEPVEAALGIVRCEFIEASGRRERYWARRTSPCAATIIEIAMPGDPQHYGDRVVYEPTDVDAHARDEDGHRPCFEVVAILEPGRHRAFLLRGFDPGRPAIEALRARVREAGWGFERITAEGRSAADPREGADGEVATPREVPTIGVLVAIPEDEAVTRLRALILEATADWPLPLLDPKLDAAAGEPEAAADAAALLDRWKP